MENMANLNYTGLEMNTNMTINDVTLSIVDSVFENRSLSGLANFQIQYARVHGYISSCVCLFGFLANIANILVLTRKNMITSTNVILTWLALADLLTMLDYFPFVLHFYIVKDQDLVFHATRGYGWMCYFLFHLNFSILCHSFAIWLTIALATFRFVCIWFPTRGNTYCTVARAKQCIAILFGTVLVLCIPNYIVNDMNEIYQNVTTNNITKHDVYYEWRYRSGGAFDHINNMNKLIQATLFKIIPCALLTTLTLLLIVAMHRAYKKRIALKSQGRREESDRHGEQHRTTGMLLAVVMLFLFTELPQGILTIISMISDTFYLDVYMALGDLLDIMALCNNAINFVLYSTMSRQFRNTFENTFCWYCPKKKPGWMKMKHVKCNTVQNGSSFMTEQIHV